jgi:hypothetical protein
MSSNTTPTATPPSTPGRQSYNPLFLKAKVLIEASKAGDLHTIEQLCKNKVACFSHVRLITNAHTLQGQDVNTRTLIKQESPLHKVGVSPNLCCAA